MTFSPRKNGNVKLIPAGTQPSMTVGTFFNPSVFYAVVTVIPICIFGTGTGFAIAYWVHLIKYYRVHHPRNVEIYKTTQKELARKVLQS